MIIHFIVLLIILYLSFRQRVRIKNRFHKDLGDLPTDPLPSPISTALTEMLGVAGGIYLALVMAVSFLQIDVPPKVDIYGLNIEPLALTAVILSLIQPYFVEIKRCLKRGGR